MRAGIPRTLSVLALLPVCLLTGCAGSTPAPAPSAAAAHSISPALKAEFDEYLAKPNLTPFEKQVLSDYWISDAEYKQAQDLFAQCMKGKGYIVSYSTASDQYTVTQIPGIIITTDFTSDVTSCQAGTVASIEPLYQNQQYNPEVLSTADLVRSCYAKHGVTDGAGMSEEQFQQMLDDASYCPSTPAAKLCFMDPQGQWGFSQAQADQQACHRTTTTHTVTAPPS
jgi:hypothetical protein